MKIGLAEMDICWEDKQKNMDKCRRFLQKAKELSVDFILFPEMSLTGFSMNVNKIGEEHDESLVWFMEAAKAYNINMGFGYVEKNNTKGKNVFCIISKQGEVLAKYVKIHPFSYGKETLYFESGNDIVLAKIDDFSMSPFICYDLRFPEIFQSASKQAQLITVAANWPKSRREHWITLLKARAIENQCYIAGVNRVGIGENIQYSGDSFVIDPLGNIVSQCISLTTDENSMEKLITGIINVEDVLSARSSFKLKEDRKEPLYCLLYQVFDKNK